MSDFETIYRRHASAVFRFALGLSGNRAEAEDLVSETFVRVLTRAPRIETRTAKAYLLAVTRNVFLNRRRNRSKEIPLIEDLEDQQLDQGNRLIEQGRLRIVLQALRNAPETEKTALLLRIDHDLPYGEIASVLGISVGAAKVRVHRARVRLTEALQQGENDGKRNNARHS